ncbi:hypothetical protein MRX96_045370, partial [Rhipicephalus microplus]
SRMDLQSLTMRQTYELELRHKNLETEKKIANEQRHLDLEECKLALAERQHEFQATNRKQEHLHLVKSVVGK